MASRKSLYKKAKKTLTNVPKSNKKVIKSKEYYKPEAKPGAEKIKITCEESANKSRTIEYNLEENQLVKINRETNIYNLARTNYVEIKKGSIGIIVSKEKYSVVENNKSKSKSKVVRTLEKGKYLVLVDINLCVLDGKYLSSLVD